MLEELGLSEEEDLEDIEPTSAIQQPTDDDELGSLISELANNSTPETVEEEPEAEADIDDDDIEALLNGTAAEEETGGEAEDDEEIDEEAILNNVLDEIDEIEEMFNEKALEETEEDLEDIFDEAPAEEPEEEEIIEAAAEEVIEEPAIEEPEEEEDPMAALKDISANTVGEEIDSFDKLKSLSKRIIDGEPVDLGINIKSEISELLKLIMETKQRVDEIEPTIATSNQHIPNVLNTLESVTETTEDATFTLMENADALNNYYQEFVEEINDLEDLIYKKDVASIVRKIEHMEKSMEEADSMGFNILQALEFQDITEQKLRKVINSISDIGARLGAILGFIKLKQDQDPTVADDASQDDIDKLLAEFGLD
jgi:chemotaxis regulatin CheY-phosphate phosphatase CheZ